jgi:uncharacterized RDD family membrane protein YckC
MSTTNPYAAPKSRVADVDDVVDLVLAGRGARFGAYLVDGIITACIVYVPMIVTGAFSGAMAQSMAGDPLALYRSFVGVGGLISLIGMIAWIVITIRLVSQNGQTIGKKLLNIKVIRSDGSKASLGRIFWLRNVVNSLLSIIPFYLLVDLLFIFGERKQCLHDKIADTIVVNA